MAAKKTYAEQLEDFRSAAQAAHAKYDAWKPDSATTNLPSWMQPREGQALSAPVLAMMQMNNPNRAEMQTADADVTKLIRSHLQDQLKGQAKQYGFGWKGNKNEDYHTGAVADMLAGQGLTDLSQLGYSKDGNYLMNKETGENLKWYKQDKHKDNPLKNKGQLGWSAKGTGRTNYMVKADANGNPVLFPEWKSNAPGGLGGFLVDALPAIAGAIGGPWAAAAASGLEGAIGGKGIGDILKDAAVSGGGSWLGGKAGALTSGATAGMSDAARAAIANAATGATQGAVRGIANGNFDLGNVLTDALSAGAAGGIKNLLSPGALPAGQSGPPVAGAGDLTSVPVIGKYLPGVVGNTVAGAIRGQDIENALTNNLAGAAGQAAGSQVAGLVPDTGSAFLNNVLQKGSNSLASQAVADTLRSSPSNAANLSSRTIAPTTYARQTATAPAVNNQGNLLNYLALAGMSGQQSGAPVVASNIPAFNLEQMFAPQAKPQASLQQLLQSYNQGRVA